MKSNNCILMLIALSVLVNACYPAGQAKQPTPIRPSVPVDLTDRSWLTDQPCKAPCWYGMVVGKTTRPEALEFVKSISFLRSEPVREYSFGYVEKNSNDLTTEGKGLVFWCVQPEGWECVYLDFFNDVLVGIRSLITYEISLDQVVKSIGPPDHLYRYVNGGPEKTIACTVGLIWLERRLTVDVFEVREGSGRDLCKEYNQNHNKPYPNLLVDEIHIYTLDEINKLEKDTWSGFVTP